MSKPRHKSAWGRLPAKGTKTRHFLLLALRPQGVTAAEAGLAGERVGTIVRQMRDFKGFDIRAFPLKGMGKTKPPNAYKVVGRLKWNGGYRSLCNGGEYA